MTVDSLPSTNSQMLKFTSKCMQKVALVIQSPEYYLLAHAAKQGMDTFTARLLFDALGSQAYMIGPEAEFLVRTVLGVHGLGDAYASFHRFVENLVSSHATHSILVANSLVASLRQGKPFALASVGLWSGLVHQRSVLAV